MDDIRFKDYFRQHKIKKQIDNVIEELLTEENRSKRMKLRLKLDRLIEEYSELKAQELSNRSIQF